MHRSSRPTSPFSRNREGGGQGISRLFQSSNRSQIANQFSRSQSDPSFLQSIANPEKISAFLGQTNKMIQSAQQFKPIVEQYGPMVKNVPAMFKMLRTFNEQTKQEEKVTPTKASTNQATTQPTSKKKSGDSRPKLYV